MNDYSLPIARPASHGEGVSNHGEGCAEQAVALERRLEKHNEG